MPILILVLHKVIKFMSPLGVTVKVWKNNK